MGKKDLAIFLELDILRMSIFDMGWPLYNFKTKNSLINTLLPKMLIN